MGWSFDMGSWNLGARDALEWIPAWIPCAEGQPAHEGLTKLQNRLQNSWTLPGDWRNWKQVFLASLEIKWNRSLSLSDGVFYHLQAVVLLCFTDEGGSFILVSSVLHLVLSFIACWQIHRLASNALYFPINCNWRIMKLRSRPSSSESIRCLLISVIRDAKLSCQSLSLIK